LNDDLLLESLRHADARVRQQGVLLADARNPMSVEMKGRVVRLAADPDPQVRFSVLLALAPATSRTDMDAIRQIAIQDIDDEWTRRATAIAAGTRAGELVTLILENPPWQSKAASVGQRELMRELIAMAVRGVGDDVAAQVLKAVLDSSDPGQSGRVQRVMLQALAESLARQRKSVRQIAERVPDDATLKRFEAALARPIR
jgi:hypothetical protein